MGRMILRNASKYLFRLLIDPLSFFLGEIGCGADSVPRLASFFG